MRGWREDKSSPQTRSSHNGAWNQVGVLKLLLQYLHVYIALILPHRNVSTSSYRRVFKTCGAFVVHSKQPNAAEDTQKRQSTNPISRILVREALLGNWIICASASLERWATEHHCTSRRGPSEGAVFSEGADAVVEPFGRCRSAEVCEELVLFLMNDHLIDSSDSSDCFYHMNTSVSYMFLLIDSSDWSSDPLVTPRFLFSSRKNGPKLKPINPIKPLRFETRLAGCQLIWDANGAAGVLACGRRCLCRLSGSLGPSTPAAARCFGGWKCLLRWCWGGTHLPRTFQCFEEGEYAYNMYAIYLISIMCVCMHL